MEELETNVRSASLMHVKASPQGVCCLLLNKLYCHTQPIINFQVIQETLHKQHSSFLALANHVASTHEQVEKAVSEFKDYAKRFQMDEALKYVSVLSPESGKGVSFIFIFFELVNLDVNAPGTKGELTLSEMGEGLVPETVVSSAPAGSVGFGATPFGNGSTSLFGRK